MRTFKVNENDANQRIDKFVSKITKGMPKSLLYKFIRTKRIKCNGKRVHEADIIENGDIIEMYIPDEFFESEVSVADYTRAKITPSIVYEDDNILLCDKKPGILVHLGDEGDKNTADAAERETLIFALTAHLIRNGEFDPKSENSFAPALCNRIDRNTGGIVILAKNASTLRDVNEAIRENRVHKTYLCAVHGRLEGAKTLTAYHSKNFRTNTVTIHDRKLQGTKEIITKYSALAYNKSLDLSLVEISLITGRTHQIRAHMAHVGFPLLGEGKYAKNASDKKLGFSSQALYSCAVSFDFSESTLKYLNGEKFAVDPIHIDFLRLFPNFSYKEHFKSINSYK